MFLLNCTIMADGWIVHVNKERERNMRKKLAVWSLFCFILCAVLSLQVQAAWKTTAQGKMYTTTKAPGYYTGWHTIKNVKYYFSSAGIMQTGWQKINGKYYYFGTNGKMRVGWQTINNKTYYFSANGARKNGWLTVKSGELSLKYYFRKGVMQTGVQKIKNKLYYFNESGVRQYGFIRTAGGKVYYANKSTGVLAHGEWISNYYFDDNGVMAVNQWIEGKWVGADGRYTGVRNNVGWVTDNGRTCYYDRNSQKVYGWLTVSGKKYYLNSSTGALQYGWFKVGNYTYYADKKGIIQTSKWMGKKYLKSSGAMATGWLTINGKRYCFDSKTGEKKTGWVKKGKSYYYMDKNGVKQVNSWINGKYYVGSKGARAAGVTKIGSKYYYFSRKNGGELLKGWIKYGSDLYYAHSTKGYLFVNKWFTKGSNKYYAGADCALYRGLKTISGKIYYFNMTNGRMSKSVMTKIGGSTYYFGSDGAAAASKWVKYKSKYYYFENNGKMAVSKWVGKYYVGADGARTDRQLTVGLQTINGKKYCYDSDGKQMTGWQTVSGSKYYFSTADGAALTGLQVISSKKYYFYPTGILATGLVLAISDKEYTIGSDGVVTAERTINISGNTVGSRLAKFAVKYVGNPYVYGGVSLTNGADCSGFVQTVFANYNIKLLRVADDQMKGPNATYIKAGYKTAVTVSVSDMLPGDLVFYGSSNYASHVGIYIGNGQIVHASNSQPYPAGGIKISPYNYQTPLRIVRYWS